MTGVDQATMTGEAVANVEIGAPAPKNWKRLATPALTLAAAVVVGLSIGHDTPTWLDLHVRPWFDSVYKWSQLNNDTNWSFRYIFRPTADVIASSNDLVLWALRTLRWPGVLGLIGCIGYRTGGRRAAATGVVAFAGCGLLGFWDHTLITVSLMLVAVAISLAIGIPLGIWAGLSSRADRIMRGVLDTAQVMPAFCYLLPLVVAFGIGIPPAVVATIIYAVPPAVRLTSSWAGVQPNDVPTSLLETATLRIPRLVSRTAGGTA